MKKVEKKKLAAFSEPFSKILFQYHHFSHPWDSRLRLKIIFKKI